MPGSRAGQSAPGLIHWLAGKFTTSEREDLAIVYRTAFEGSEVMELRNGTTGELIWLSTFGGFSACGTGATGTGGTHMPVFDWDSDGLDDILNNWRNMFTVYKGSTGEILINLSNGGEGCPEPNPDHIIFSENFDALPMTVVADFLGNGSQRVLYTKNEVTLALLNTQGVVQWNTPLYQGMPFAVVQGVADLDGNPGLEILAVAVCDGSSGDEVRAFDAAGKQRWSMALPSLCDGAEPSALATGDLNGDGRDEAYFTGNGVLWSVGENEAGTAGEIYWHANFTPGELSYPVIADVDGSGRPVLLINHADAYLYALGSTQLSPLEIIFTTGFE